MRRLVVYFIASLILTQIWGCRSRPEPTVVIEGVKVPLSEILLPNERYLNSVTGLGKGDSLSAAELACMKDAKEKAALLNMKDFKMKVYVSSTPIKNDDGVFSCAKLFIIYREESKP